MRYKAKVQNGKMIVHEREKFVTELSGYEGKEISVSIEIWKNKRSTCQNRYYFGYVIEPISTHTGHSPDEIHEIMKAMFNMIQGNGMPIIRSTRGMSTVEFMEYIAKIKKWAFDEMKITILDPGEVPDEQIQQFYS